MDKLIELGGEGIIRGYQGLVVKMRVLRKLFLFGEGGVRWLSKLEGTQTVGSRLEIIFIEVMQIIKSQGS